MSVSHAKRIAKARPPIDYETFGAIGSARYKRHKTNGTDRNAAMRCDCGTQFDFADRAEMLRDTNGRKIEGISLIQSFENTEFDPGDRSRVQYVNDLGYEFGKKLASDSDVLVITHVDGSGGHPHNHIKIMNHVNSTGKALRLNTMHYAVSRVNDELMREHGLRVVTQPEGGGIGYQNYWEMQRDGAAVSAYEQRLGDLVMEARDVCDNTKAGFIAVLTQRGIELVEEEFVIKASADGTKPEHVSVGWTYKMVDDTGEKPRMRRRKASGLADDLTHDAVMELFADRAQQLTVQAPTAPVTVAPSLPAHLAALTDDQRQWFNRIRHFERFEARLKLLSGSVPLSDASAIMAALEREKAQAQAVAELVEIPTFDDEEPVFSGSRSVTEPVPTTTEVEPVIYSAADRERDELALLTLRYRTVTEGPSWSDDEYEEVMKQTVALKASLRLAEDDIPFREDIIDEYERRVLGLQPADSPADGQSGALPASASTTAPTSTAELATARTADVQTEQDEQVSSPATAGASASASATVPTSIHPDEYVSRIRDRKARTAKEKATNERWAEFDEYAYGRLYFGKRLEWDRGELLGVKGIGADGIARYGSDMSPRVVIQLDQKVEAARYATELYEGGLTIEGSKRRRWIRSGFFEEAAKELTSKERTALFVAQAELNVALADADRNRQGGE